MRPWIVRLALLGSLTGCEPSSRERADGGPADADASDVARRDAGTGPCASDLDCDDGDFCNGVEFCAGVGGIGVDSRGCLRRSRGPEEYLVRCRGAACSDRDGDGHRPIMDNGAFCSGDRADDCDDADSLRFPRSSAPNPERRWLGTAESCGLVHHDEDCDPLTIAGPGQGDADGDGYPSGSCCNPIAPLNVSMSPMALQSLRLRRIGGAMDGMICGMDCDDSNPQVHPGAPEDPCNGRDDNCDARADEGGRGLLYRDCDGDGDGDTAEGSGVPDACVAPPAIICNGFPGARSNTDCNDRDPRVRGGRGPELARTECDGLDNNCDGLPDNGAGMECALALPGRADPSRPCMDTTCSSLPGVQTCVACRWTPGTCARSYDRPVFTNNNGHECEPGEITNQRCSLPGRTGSCGRVVCSQACEIDPRGQCHFDAEVCDYRDQDCNDRVDEGLGQSCSQTWEAAGDGFSRDWQFAEANVDAANGEVVLSTGTRGQAGLAFLPLTVDRSRGIEIEVTMRLTRGESEALGDGVAIALIEAPVGSTDVGIPVVQDGQQGVPTDARGYFFRMGYNGLSAAPFLAIQRRDVVTREIQRVDLPISSVVTGDTCAGAGTFLQINSGSPSVLYRGGGRNTFVLSITDQLLTASVTYVGRPGGCITISGSEPDGIFVGRPLRLAIFASSHAQRSLAARLLRVQLRRPCQAQGGGVCGTAPNYCAQSARCS